MAASMIEVATVHLVVLTFCGLPFAGKQDRCSDAARQTPQSQPQGQFKYVKSGHGVLPGLVVDSGDVKCPACLCAESCNMRVVGACHQA
jgi:hypothetical protein